MQNFSSTDVAINVHKTYKTTLKTGCKRQAVSQNMDREAQDPR